MDGDEPVANGGASVADGTPGGSAKRKRSPSAEAPVIAAPPTKTAKTHSSSHLQINYLARQYADTLPLVALDDNMPGVLQLLSDYAGVLERHESLASNLGARPLGPILIQRFERLFDGQPRVLKSHSKDMTTVSWLDVVEFARQKPEQFNLEKTRDGVRVCQFYTKQCRVEISEDDFTLIASGLPQKLIPPQPISEDEEKELGTLEIMEKRIASIIQLADQVSARARQTKHRITGRRNAIAARRETEQLAETAKAGTGADGPTSPTEATAGFRAVNSHRPEKLNGLGGAQTSRAYTGATASPTTHAELLSCFNNSRQRLSESGDFASPTSARPNVAGAKSKIKPLGDSIDYAGILLSSASPVPIPNTPSTLANPRPSQAERYDDSGPFKSEMLSRMENMARGERVKPPCDRCRRLHMDCLKNLTACLGCTKKHAKCSFKDVTEQELADNPFPHPAKNGSDLAAPRDGSAAAAAAAAQDPSQPVRDEELLGEDSDDEDLPPAAAPAPIDAPVGNGAGARSTPPSSPRDPPASAGLSDASREGAAAPAATAELDASDRTTPVPPLPQAQVEAAARQILEKRIEERGVELGGAINGFRSVNRPVSSEPAAPTANGVEIANGVADEELLG